MNYRNGGRPIAKWQVALRGVLEERGLWRMFVDARRKAKRELAADGEKYSANEVWKRLLAGIAPELVVMVPEGRGRKSAEKLDAIETAVKMTPEEGVKASLDEIAANVDGGEDGVSSNAKVKPTCSTMKPEDFVLVSKRTFEGKTCSMCNAVMWAYSNLCVRGVTASDAPSAVAWQIYIDMKTNVGIKMDLLKSWMGSAIKKSEADSDKGVRWDGENEYDVLAAIGGAGE